MNTCGNKFMESCTVDTTQTFSPRVCSVVFKNLPASSYAYIAEVQADNPPLEANIFNMSGSFDVAGKFLVFTSLYSQDSYHYH